MIEGGQPPVGPRAHGREQERRTADPRRLRAHGGAGHAARTSRASATWTRCWRCSRHVGADAEWTGANEVRVHAAEIATHELDEELCREIRASILLAGPAARALWSGSRAPTRRRRDRPAAHRHAHPRARRARRPRSPSAQHYELEGPARRDADVPRRGERDRHRERGHGRRPRPRRDRDRERRLRAARPGPLPVPRRARRAHRRDRLEPHPRRGRRAAQRRLAPDLPRAHRGRELHRPRSRHRQRDHDRRHGAGGPGVDPARVRAARRARRDRGNEPPRPFGSEAHRPGRPRRPDPEDRGRPLACLSGRPDVDRRRPRDAGARHDADLREDVREPPVLRRQARRDGGEDHRLRPAPRRRRRPGEAVRRSAWRARTSAPAWRC